MQQASADTKLKLGGQKASPFALFRQVATSWRLPLPLLPGEDPVNSSENKMMNLKITQHGSP